MSEGDATAGDMNERVTPAEASLSAPPPIAAESEKKAKRRQRKSNRPYPPSTFEEAVKFAREIYEFGAGNYVRKLTFYDHLGKSPESSASRDAITNANKYGLVKGSYSADQLELTHEALAIVADDTSPRERTKAKITLGIQRIDHFNQLFERIAGARLPAKSVLVDNIREIGVPEDLCEEAVDIFIVKLRFVDLLQVLSGAERVVTIEHLLDNLPSAGENKLIEARPEFKQTVNATVKRPNTIASESSGLDTTCFYITPIGIEGTEVRKHSDLFLASIVEPAVSSLQLSVVRADAIGQPGIITRQIIEYILKARLVVADLSFHNPNVFYELALRHAARLPIVQIIRKSENVPFDINQMRTIVIDNSDIYTFVPNIEIYRSEVATQARRALEPDHEIDTPISVYFPGLKATLS